MLDTPSTTAPVIISSSVIAAACFLSTNGLPEPFAFFMWRWRILQSLLTWPLFRQWKHCLCWIFAASILACMSSPLPLSLTSLPFLTLPYTAPICIGATPPAASLALAMSCTSSLTLENVSSLLACMIKCCRNMSSCMRSVASPHFTSSWMSMPVAWVSLRHSLSNNL